MAGRAHSLMVVLTSGLPGPHRHHYGTESLACRCMVPVSPKRLSLPRRAFIRGFYAPPGYVVAGRLDEFLSPTGDVEEYRFRSYESFRRSIAGITILTYDDAPIGVKSWQIEFRRAAPLVRWADQSIMVRSGY
jgi:hypothetical protein